MTLAEMEFIRLAGILFPGNRVRANPLPLGAVVSGSAIWNVPPVAVNVCVKSPARCKGVGTVNR